MDAYREHIQGMARMCRAQFDESSETYKNCEAWEKLERVVGVLGDVEFELERWLLRQDDLRTRLKVSAVDWSATLSVHPFDFGADERMSYLLCAGAHNRSAFACAREARTRVSGNTSGILHGRGCLQRDLQSRCSTEDPVWTTRRRKDGVCI